MRIRRSLPLVLAAILVVAVVPGCFKIKQVVTVMPDGSGKMEFRFGFNEQVIKDAVASMGGGMGGPGGGGGMGPGGGMGMKDPTDVDVTDLEKNFEGFVAFTHPDPEEGAGGWKYMTFTGYFEDASKVKIYDGGRRGRALKTSLGFEKADGGFTFSMTNRLGADAAGGNRAEQVPPEMEAMVQGMLDTMMEGFEAEETVRMPGAVKTAEGLPTVDGRTASMKMTKADMKTMADMKKIGETREIKVTCGESALTPEELAAFKVEMEKAKVEWAETKAKAAAEKAAAEKEKEKEGEGGGGVELK